MRIFSLLAALLALLPAPGTAQLDPDPVRPRFSISAYTGARAPYTTGFLSAVQVAEADSAILFSATEQRGGSPVLGLEAAVRLLGPVSLVLGGAFSQTGESDYFLDRQPAYRDTTDFTVLYPGNTWFAKGALSARFESTRRLAESRPGPATEVFAGGGVLRMMGSNHPALNVGFKGAFPLAYPGLEVVVGVEDYLVFWNRDASSTDLGEVLSLPSDPVDFVQFYYDTSNVILLRAGVSVRL